MAQVGEGHYTGCLLLHSLGKLRNQFTVAWLGSAEPDLNQGGLSPEPLLEDTVLRSPRSVVRGSKGR